MRLRRFLINEPIRQCAPVFWRVLECWSEQRLTLANVPPCARMRASCLANVSRRQDRRLARPGGVDAGPELSPHPEDALGEMIVASLADEDDDQGDEDA